MTKSKTNRRSLLAVIAIGAALSLIGVAAAAERIIQGVTLSGGAITATGASTFGATGVQTHIDGTLLVDETSVFTGAATFTASPTSPDGTTAEAWGAGASATGTNSVAIGANATADTTTTEDQLTAVGASAVASGDGASAYGYSADATGLAATAVGADAQATGANATAVGRSATAASSGTSLGGSAVASGTNSVSLGTSSQATGTASVAVGRTADSGHDGAIAINGASTAVNQFVAGSAGAPVLEFQTGTTANSANLAVVSNSELLATTSGATVTTSGLIPAGVTVLHVASRVTTTVTTSSATDTFGVGDADPDRYGAAIAGAGTTTQDHTDYTADPAGTWSASGREIILDAAGAETFTAGAVRVTVWYTIPTAPGS